MRRAGDGRGSVPAGDVEVVEHQDSGPQLFNELLPEVGQVRKTACGAWKWAEAQRYVLKLGGEEALRGLEASFCAGLWGQAARRDLKS